MPCRNEFVAAPPARRTPAAVAGRPWERPGAVRRDCQPHRDRLLLALGDASLLLGALSLPLGFPAVAGAGLGAAAWALASRDLKRMQARLMDPDGLSGTALARNRALLGLILSLYALALWACFLVRVS
jgi:hypothetical protein